MGAYTTPSRSTPPTNPRRGNSLFYMVMGILVLFALKWRDVVEYIDGKPQLTTKYQQKMDNKVNEPDAAEQYALVADVDGYYICLHGGHTKYFLRAGEIWKYGVTVKGERGRYTAQFLQDNAVSYIIQFRGPIKECLREEQRKLFMYPILPENLARNEEDRLIRPPYNPILR